MRVFIDCEDEILARALEMFLADFRALDASDADFIVSDVEKQCAKPLFLIGVNGDLELPFSKEQLCACLQSFNKSALMQTSEIISDVNDDTEAQISAVFDEFKARIIEILRKNNG